MENHHAKKMGKFSNYFYGHGFNSKLQQITGGYHVGIHPISAEWPS
jgi:hypothetical protein